jgi:Phosphoribulokinase / Uridine kinase family
MIFQGILIFINKALRDLMDIKILADMDVDLRFLRRRGRDIREGGRTVESVVEQFRAMGTNRIGCNPGTRISPPRRAVCATPIGRLAFPGDRSSNLELSQVLSEVFDEGVKFKKN